MALISARHRTGNVQPKFVPTIPPGTYQPCPDTACDPDGVMYCRPAFKPVAGVPTSEACRGLYLSDPNAAQVVFRGAKPTSPPVNPCPGQTCKRVLYDLDGIGYIEWEFRADGSIGHRNQTVRIPHKIDYLAPILVDPSFAAANSGYGKGEWVDVLGQPGVKAWVLQGLKPKQTTPPDAPDDQDPSPQTFATIQTQQEPTPPAEQQGFGFGPKQAECGIFDRQTDDGECKFNWPLVAGAAAALWFLTG